MERNLVALLLIAVLAVPSEAKNERLIILPAGETQTKPIGSSFRLTCKPKVPESKLISDMHWLDPHNRRVESLNAAPPGIRPTIYTELQYDNSMSLFFDSLSEDQAGKYICKAMYANTELLTDDVKIETIVAITWDDAPTNQFPILGEDFAIKCQVRARPSPTVDWLYNGEIIKTNDHYIIETHALRIKNVQESDDGVYTCRASVPETGELQQRAIRVEVHTKPSIVEPTNSIVEVTEGENANIICQGAGKPPPKFSWTKSITKEDLSMTDRFGVNEDSGVLTITNVKREDDSEYECRATNAAGVATMNIQVTVIVKPKIKSFVNATIAKDNRGIISCVAFGKPPPEITFRKHTSSRAFSLGTQADDDRIVLANRIENQKNDETIGELIFDRALRSDDGMYECIAKNKGGKAFKNGHLAVEFPPTFDSMPNRTYWSWDQKPVNLTCIAESIPNATIRWTYFGDKEVRNDPQIRIYGNGPVSALYIRPLDTRHFTTYRCIASNKYGEAVKYLELRNAPKPAEVPQASMIETTATTITFDIVPPVGETDLPIRTISVQYKKQDENWNLALNRTWTVGSQGGYVVENLWPQTNYDFRFAASNDAGRGVWGLHKRFTTPSRNVPGPARFLPTPEKEAAISPYHDRYSFKWAAPPDNGERIDLYEIKWCEAKKYSGEREFEVLENTCRDKTETKRDTWITGLYPDTYYKIEVRAHNKLGWGVPANMTAKTSRGIGNASVLQHQGSIISSTAIICIVIAVLIIIMLIVDALLCCTNKSGIIYYMCERSRRKPVDEEDAKLGRDEKEPLKEEKKITPIVESGIRESSVTFDGKSSIAKTGYTGKDSAV